ncbi:hypothetical protein FA13DRAFT_1785715 [Coprinellus micaceus]|uniref:Integrase core domain-containing protein n=1 Tax=Coprinellus micaceus TaxID=71717 RepID=A0A4Y7TVC3_COPMI|nr:hypothetical protein FA13DRAFT_1785715 [Coprinellus micaceus]
MGKNKPLPPRSFLDPLIIFYYDSGKSDKESLDLIVRYHLDTTTYGLGYSSFRKIRRSMDLLGTRQQAHTLESIQDQMQELRVLFPNAGMLEMKSHLFDRYRMKVARSIIESFFATFEPELRQARLGRKLVRMQFWAAGINVLWCFDQHDKWKYKFGLCFHVGVDPFSGYLLWLRVWWNNSNPQLICSYYLDTVEGLGYIPLMTQSDPGTENTRIADAQTHLRQLLDPQLAGSIQHNWKRKKTNVKAEIEWSQFRRRWAPGFENILERGVVAGHYDLSNPIQVLLFRCLAIPWLQGELDRYRQRVNNFKPRKNVHKLTPHGRRQDLHFRPQDFGARDFKVLVPPQDVALARETYIDAGHSVFQLVPPTFAEVVNIIYVAMGQPPVSEKNFWSVYCDVLDQIEAGIEAETIPHAVVREWAEGVVRAVQEDDQAQRQAEVEEAQGAPNLFADPSRPPQGFVVVNNGGEGLPTVQLTDDEDESDGEAWLVDP